MPLLSIHINPSKKLMLHKGNSRLCARQQYQRRHISEQKHFFALNECYKFLNDKNICVFVTIFSEEVSTNVPSLHGNSDWKLSHALTNNYLVTPSLYVSSNPEPVWKLPLQKTKYLDSKFQVFWAQIALIWWGHQINAIKEMRRDCDIVNSLCSLTTYSLIEE